MPRNAKTSEKEPYGAFSIFHQFNTPEKMDKLAMFLSAADVARVSPSEEQVGETMHVMDTISSHLYRNYLRKELASMSWFDTEHDQPEDDLTEDVDGEIAEHFWIQHPAYHTHKIRGILREDGFLGLIAYAETGKGVSRKIAEIWLGYGREVSPEEIADMVEGRNKSIREVAIANAKAKKERK